MSKGSPKHRQNDVLDALRALDERDPSDPGGLMELRQWQETWSRLSCFSKELCLRYGEAIRGCLAAQRPPKTQPTQEYLQQSFVRMGGLDQAVEVMLIRLSDASVVAAVTRLLAQAAQGAPLAAEALAGQGSTLKLLLRSVERHAATSAEVAEAGCLLFCHLCSLPPHATTEVCPARMQAHRTTQTKIAQEGALDLLATILGSSVREVGRRFAEVERMEAAFLGDAQKRKAAAAAPQVVARRRSDAVAQQAEATQQKEEAKEASGVTQLQHRWEQILKLEAEASRVQSAALQALILTATKNPDSTRMMIGALATEAAPEAQPGSPPAVQRKMSVASNNSKPGSSPGSRRGSMLSALDRRGSAVSRRGSQMQLVPEDVAAVAQEDQAPASSSTVDAMAASSATVVDVLASHLARDRPEVCTRACRALEIIVAHHMELLKKVALHGKACVHMLDVTAGKGDRGVGAGDNEQAMSFEPLRPMVSALLTALRTHIRAMPVLAAVLTVLADLRQFAVLSATALAGGEDALLVWRRLLADVAQPSDLPEATDALRKALHSTEMAEKRMAHFRMQSSDFIGNGVYLTPRTKGAAERAQDFATELVADVTMVQWANGEPGRRERRARELAAERGGPDSPGSHSSLGDSDTCSQASSCLSPSVGSRSPSARAAAGVAGTEEPDIPQPQFPTSPQSPDYVGALGYEECSPEDFERIWRRPIRDAMARSFSTPAVLFGQRKKNQSSRLVDAPADADDALDKMLKVNFVEAMAPNKIKIHVTLQPHDRAHKKAFGNKIQDLSQPEHTKHLISDAVSKEMRKQGQMVPKHGLEVTVRRRTQSVPASQQSPQSLLSPPSLSRKSMVPGSASVSPKMARKSTRRA